jgi:subtilisin family serine protease
MVTETDTLNHVHVKGLTKEALLSLSAVMEVFPDKKRYTSKYSWGQDRINNPNLPLDDNTAESYNGKGVTVHVIDTGIDITHPEVTHVTALHSIHST